jgi:chromosome partitioning protein
MQLAGALAKRGHAVLVVDADEQGTALRWSAAATQERPFPARVINLAAAGPALHLELRKHVATGCDFVLVDCPSNVLSPASASALLVSDLALVPLSPSAPDMWAVLALQKLIQGAQVNNPDLRVLVVPTRVQHTALSRDTLAAYASLGWPVTRTVVGLRTAYQQSALDGSTVFELGRNAKRAQEELSELVDEVLEHLTKETVA